MGVKKEAYELSGPFNKVGAPEADSDSSNPLEKFHESIFLVKNCDLNILYSARTLFNTHLLIISMHTRRQNIK